MVSSAKMVCYKSITTELKGTRLSEEDICLINQNLSCICNIARVGVLYEDTYHLVTVETLLHQNSTTLKIHQYFNP